MTQYTYSILLIFFWVVITIPLNIKIANSLKGKLNGQSTTIVIYLMELFVFYRLVWKNDIKMATFFLICGLLFLIGSFMNKL